MALNSIQVWLPDTCDCVLHMAYDDTLPVEERTFTFVTEEEANIIVKGRLDKGELNINSRPQPKAKLCKDHEGLGHSKSRFDQVLAENKDKNMVFGTAITTLYGDNPTDDQVKDLLKKYSWNFDTNRKLQFDFVGVTDQDKMKIFTEVNKKREKTIS